MEIQDRKLENATEHNYVLLVNQLVREGKFQLGQAYEIWIHHNGWCELNRGGKCNCDCEVWLNGKRLA